MLKWIADHSKHQDVLERVRQNLFLIFVVIFLFLGLSGFAEIRSQQNDIQKSFAPIQETVEDIRQLQEERRPLGPYSVQKVVNVNKDAVTIEGELCSRATVVVETSLSFIGVSKNGVYPKDVLPGVALSFAQFRQERKKGCHTYSGESAFVNAFSNTFKELDAAIPLPHSWVVVVREKPVSPVEGVELETWSNSFNLVQ